MAAQDEMNVEIQAPQESSGMMEIATSRAAQEVQAAMIVAKKCPRDEDAAYARIMKACKRVGLAEVACYQYPKGGTTVTGPSIRLAETMAQNWGNMDFGIIELEQRKGESSVMAYAWDLETNTRQTKVFSVKHELHKKNNIVKKLTDPRDIYEMTANQGARRLRACILGIIPGDIQDDAVKECGKTLASGSSESLGDRVRKMISAFSEFNVISEMIEERLGHNISSTSEQELVTLRNIYTSLKDNMAPVGQFFSIPDPLAPGKHEAKAKPQVEVHVEPTPEYTGTREYLNSEAFPALMEMYAEHQEAIDAGLKAQKLDSLDAIDGERITESIETKLTTVLINIKKGA